MAYCRATRNKRLTGICSSFIPPFIPPSIPRSDAVLHAVPFDWVSCADEASMDMSFAKALRLPIVLRIVSVLIAGAVALRLLLVAAILPAPLIIIAIRMLRTRSGENN